MLKSIIVAGLTLLSCGACSGDYARHEGSPVPAGQGPREALGDQRADGAPPEGPDPYRWFPRNPLHCATMLRADDPI